MRAARFLCLLLAFASAAETVIVDGLDVRSIGQAYAMLNTRDGEFDTILITLEEFAEPRPVTVNGADSLTIQALRPCRITAPNRLDLFRITARSNQELVLANLKIQPAWLPPKPEEVKRKHRSVEPMHAALRVTLSSELRNFSLELRNLAISASREDRSAVPTSEAFNALDWHYRDGITIAGRPQASESNRISLDGCEISHVTESGLHLRSDHTIRLTISDCLFAQANRQGVSVDAPGKAVTLARTRFIQCNTGLLVSGKAAQPWIIRQSLFANNRADGINWTCEGLIATIEASTFFGNGSLFGAAHSNHAGSGQFTYENCIFAGAGRIAPGTDSVISLSNCNLVLAGPNSMRGAKVPFPLDIPVALDKLLVDDPQFVSTDPFADSAFAVGNDGYKALGITGFAEFAGGVPCTVSYADPNALDVARRRAASPSEREAASWAWRHRISGKPLYLDRAEAHFRGFLDVLQERLANKPEYALTPINARQACFALLALRSLQRVSAEDAAPVRLAVSNALGNWTVQATERVANGRSLLNAAGCAMIAKAFPDLDHAAALRRFANSAWEEWLRTGLVTASSLDQTSALHGVLDLAYGLEREAELRAESSRLSDMQVLVDNAGFRQSTSDLQGQTSADGIQSYWRDELSGGGSSSDAVAPWCRLAWLCKDGGFAATAARVATGGKQSDAVDALLGELGVAVEPLEPLSEVTRTGPFADRMVLAPNRGASDSYVGTWLYERGNAHNSAHPDQLGAIYSFSSGGAILLGHGNRRSSGTRNANTFVVRLPEGEQQHNSASIAMMATQFPSENWAMALCKTGGRPAEQALWAPLGDPSHGHAKFNPDGFIGLTDSLALDSIYIEISRPSLSRNELAALGPISVRFNALQLVGGKGTDLLHSLNTLKDVELLRKVRERGENGEWDVREEALSEDEKQELWAVVEDEKLGNCLEVTLLPAEAGLLLKISGLARRFDIRDDFDRLTFSHKVLGDVRPNIVLYPNADAKPRYTRGLGLGQPRTWPGRNQGGQIRDATAKMEGGDAWGSFTATNCFGSGSRWRREVVVAAEGFVVVRDVFVASEDLAGLEAGPVWHLGGKSPRPHGAGQIGDAFTQAWWQEAPPQLYVHVHGGELAVEGRAVTANSALVSGKPARFVSVLVPFAGEPPPVSVKGSTVTVGARELELPKEML
ncbi:MAG: hypothetical protein ACI8W8_001819 [Rhodothermales bacterium]